MVRGKRTAALLLGAVLLFSLTGLSAARVSAAARDSGTIKVLTWNIRHGNGKMVRQGEELALLDADVCLLQEVDEGTDRVKGYSCLETLGRGLYFGRYFGGGTSYENGEYGLGVLSKRRLRSFEPFPDIQEDIQSGLVKGVLRRNGADISIYNVHFSYLDDLHRALQIETAAEIFAADENPYKILAGDFNIKSFEDLAPFAGYGWVGSEDSYYPTYQGLDWEMQAIDNIIYTADTLALVETAMPISGLSDHNPLAATFRLLEPEQ